MAFQQHFKPALGTHVLLKNLSEADLSEADCWSQWLGAGCVCVGGGGGRESLHLLKEMIKD